MTAGPVKQRLIQLRSVLQEPALTQRPGSATAAASSGARSGCVDAMTRRRYRSYEAQRSAPAAKCSNLLQEADLLQAPYQGRDASFGAAVDGLGFELYWSTVAMIVVITLV